MFGIIRCVVEKIQSGLLCWDMNLKWLTEMHVDLFDFDEDLKGKYATWLIDRNFNEHQTNGKY